jgi:hypothetical protein
VRRRRGRIAVGFFLLGGLVGYAQDADPLAALREGQITVWVIGPPRPRSTLDQIADLHHATPLNYKEQSVGNFGSSASNFGTAAGSYGIPSDSPTISTTQPGSNTDPGANSKSPDYHEQTSGSFGQTSGSYGTVASDHGQTAGSLGQTSSSYGAKDFHEQTAGSFGSTPSTLTQATEPYGTAATTAARPASTALLALRDRVRQAFPGLSARFIDVSATDIQDSLKGVDGTGVYPDVLVGSLPDSWRPELRNRQVLATLLPAGSFPYGLNQVLEYGPEVMTPAVSVTLRAPDKEAAREFALWLGEDGDGAGSITALKLSPAEAAAAAIARAAVKRLVRGDGLGEDADPEIAAFPSQLGRLMLATSTGNVADSSLLRVDVQSATVNGQMAAVALRVVASSDRVFGVAHPLVVLRKSAAGRWRILHVSLNLPPDDQRHEREALMVSDPVTAEKRTGVAGISQASPADGDTRQPSPQLGWDNAGGAGLQVVEWQRGAVDGWSDARLYLVPDRSARLQTHVTAEFASAEGTYRWRVWSVGVAGAMKISPWRSMVIVP